MFHRDHPAIQNNQSGRAGEKGSHMPIFTHAQQDQVKNRRGIAFQSEETLHLQRVIRGSLSRIQLPTHTVDIFRRDWQVGKKLIVRQEVIAIGMLWRDQALIPPEDVDPLPIQSSGIGFLTEQGVDGTRRRSPA